MLESSKDLNGLLADACYGADTQIGTGTGG